MRFPLSTPKLRTPLAFFDPLSSTPRPSFSSASSSPSTGQSQCQRLPRRFPSNNDEPSTNVLPFSTLSSGVFPSFHPTSHPITYCDRGRVSCTRFQDYDEKSLTSARERLRGAAGSRQAHFAFFRRRPAKRVFPPRQAAALAAGWLQKSLARRHPLARRA